VSTGSEASSIIKYGSMYEDVKNRPVLFNYALFNACSTVNKIDKLALVAEAQNIDLVLITKSKLDDSISDFFLVNAVSGYCNKFRCFCKDRNRQVGGVCMLIRSCIKTIPVVTAARFAHLELVAVDILSSGIWYRMSHCIDSLIMMMRHMC